MRVCTFFGHRNAPSTIAPKLRSILIDLIENKQVTLFYVGDNGNFDSMVRKQLKLLSVEYSHIIYEVVLAYLPTVQQELEGFDCSDTIYPEGFESIPRRYAISKRNRWMIEQSDIVVTYVTHNFGGASEFANLAKKKKREVINLA